MVCCVGDFSPAAALAGEMESLKEQGGGLPPPTLARLGEMCLVVMSRCCAPLLYQTQSNLSGATLPGTGEIER